MRKYLRLTVIFGVLASCTLGLNFVANKFHSLQVNYVLSSGGRSILNNPDELILYSLDPNSRMDETQLPKFHSWGIYGHVKVVTADQRTLLKTLS